MIKKQGLQLIKEIDKWRFAECPIEEKEPFSWRWTKYGKDQIAAYIIDLLEAEKENCERHHKKERARLVKKIEKMKKKKRYYKKETDQCLFNCKASDFGYNEALIDIIGLLKNND